jgi:hypothetical protein
VPGEVGGLFIVVLPVVDVMTDVVAALVAVDVTFLVVLEF